MQYAMVFPVYSRLIYNFSNPATLVAAVTNLILIREARLTTELGVSG